MSYGSSPEQLAWVSDADTLLFYAQGAETFWRIVESDGIAYDYTTTNSVSHTRSAAGEMLVSLVNTEDVHSSIYYLGFPSAPGIIGGPINGYDTLQKINQQFPSLTDFRFQRGTLDISGPLPPNLDSYFWIGGSDAFGSVAGWGSFPHITHMYLNATDISGDASGWRFNGELQYFWCYFGPTITGDVSLWNPGSSLIEIKVYRIQGLTGSISAWTLPASLTTLELYRTQIRGVPNLGSAAALETVNLSQFTEYSAMTPADIDGWLEAIYNNRASFTAASPSIDMSGAYVPDPTGVYQDVASPSTGREFAYKIINDPDVEGFNVWVVSPDPNTTKIFCIGDSKTSGNSWVATLISNLETATAAPWDETLPRFGVTGYTAAQMVTYADANLDSDVIRIPEIALYNFGSNDVKNGLPVEATWKADVKHTVSQCLAKWPSCKVYIAKSWRRSWNSECLTMAGWIDDIVASYSSRVYVGMNENVWLENGDDGTTYTDDGVHYNSAGQIECAAQWQTVLGY